MALTHRSLGIPALLGVLALASPSPGVARSRVARLRTPLQPQREAQLGAADRRINLAAALLALAALTDSGIEHYRGSFHNKAMFIPLGAAALTLAASLRDVAQPVRAARGRDPVDAIAFVTGIVGTGFHLYNIVKRPGGFSWLNLFYSAPLGAPAALSLAGLLRKAGAFVASGTKVCGVVPSRLLAWLVSLGLIGTSAEAGLLHFRGAYHNPAMLIPITAPPLAAGLLAQAALQPGQPHPTARRALGVLTGIGLLGLAFHAYGISRNMGGWRNWSQNILNGPPLPPRLGRSACRRFSNATGHGPAKASPKSATAAISNRSGEKFPALTCCPAPCAVRAIRDGATRSPRRACDGPRYSCKPPPPVNRRIAPCCAGRAKLLPASPPSRSRRHRRPGRRRWSA
ncbi:MAG TPA: hypothetical protein VKV32_13745 [Stellaceae bacterium]|nr:hypothetical protein [Stellaceae bacterium]